MEWDRDRAIAVLRLSRRIAAEVESGVADEVEMSDEQLERIAEVLASGRARAVQLAAPAVLAATLLAPEMTANLGSFHAFAMALNS